MIRNLAILLLMLHETAFCATTFSQTFNVSAVIPDVDDVGYTSNQDITIPVDQVIASVSVGLIFQGGFNGDLFAYLVHDNAIAILLNRPGRDANNPDGSASSGMTVTLTDLGISDIHTSIPMFGGVTDSTFQPDGRTADPLDVLSTDPRPAMLSSFVGKNPNGRWSLFVADQNAGDESTLVSWTLTINSVPETSTTLLLCSSILMVVCMRHRRV
jgi:Proprotein convertase P-domain